MHVGLDSCMKASKKFWIIRLGCYCETGPSHLGTVWTETNKAYMAMAAHSIHIPGSMTTPEMSMRRSSLLSIKILQPRSHRRAQEPYTTFWKTSVLMPSKFKGGAASSNEKKKKLNGCSCSSYTTRPAGILFKTRPGPREYCLKQYIWIKVSTKT